MPLPTNLQTNEVKDRTGTEVEFVYFDEVGRKRIFAQKDEVPSLPHKLWVSHQESGSGAGLVRRSCASVDKSFVGKSGKVVQARAYKIVVVPMGELDDLNIVKDLSAELDSFCATTGAGTTVLFDGSGSGDACLINGWLSQSNFCHRPGKPG